MTTHIQLQLYATFKTLTPPLADEFPIKRGATVKELLTTIGISPDQAKLIFVNGQRAEPEDLLQGGERVGIFPPVGGG